MDLIAREYGSEFWITDDIVDNSHENGYLLGINEIHLVNGRRCVSYLLDSINNIPKRAVLPAYICDSVVEPFAERGFTTLFYDTNRKFEPDLNEIAALIDGKPSVFMHLGYFGFATNENIVGIEDLIEETGTITFEDRAHTLFTSLKHRISDAEFASIRKWIGIPGGGIINPISNIFCFEEIDNVFTMFSERRLECLKMKASYMETGEKKLRERYRIGFKEAEKLIEDDKSVYLLDDFSIGISKRLNIKKLVERRRANFSTLLEHLSQNNRFIPIFSDLPENVCPMFFPIFILDGNERDYLQKKFASKNLFCPIHWPRNNYVKSHLDGYEYIVDHILSIPCDQRYSDVDMNRIVEIVS